MLSGKTKMFKKTMKCFLNSSITVKEYLQRLSFLLVSSESNKNILLNVIPKTTNPIGVFKILILVHHCVNINVALHPEKLIQAMGAIKCQSQSSFAGYLIKEVIEPYVAYLQKRILQEKQIFSSANQGLLTSKAYAYINLLRLGLKFSKSIMTLGRYYSRKYGFIVDFNRVIGIDFQETYKEIQNCLEKIDKEDDNYLTIVKEIEKINERMYCIYYNCYFYQQLCKYVPEWIDTAFQESQIRKMKSSLSSSRGSIKNHSLTFDSINESQEEAVNSEKFEVEEYQKMLNSILEFI